MNRLPLLCSMLLAFGLTASSQYRVAVVGSSTAGGAGARPQDSSWVNRFNHYYKHQLQLVDSTYTLALGGYPVYKGMPGSFVPPPDRDGPDHNRNITRANAYLASLPLPLNGIVIINYPTNKYEEYSMAEIMNCLQTMYDSVLQEGHRCYIVTAQPRSGGVWDAPALKRKLALIKDSIIHRFGTANTINFYDGLYDPADSTILAKYHSGDGIHFNNEGHRELFERVRTKNLFHITLPLKLPAFGGEYRNNRVSLQWTAECSHPNMSFTVQHSADGKKYNNLTKIEAIAKHSTYHFTDTNPQPGRNFYRLQIRDSPQIFYSNAVLIKSTQPGLVLNNIYPDPSNKHMLVASIDAAQQYTATIRVLSISGLPLVSRDMDFKKGARQFHLPLEHLPGGQYFLSIRYGDGQSILRSFSK